ncbi:integration host factor subunit alpha [bacterium]|jgi:integration host factor subunit alpha|nr:integration host factor subunit alpha [bacterium]
MTLTKTEIVNSIQNQLGFPKNHTTDIVENLMEIMKRSLESGDDVLIRGFGKFCVKEKSERKGRNIATGKDMMLDKRRVVTFKCARELKDRINGIKK